MKRLLDTEGYNLKEASFDTFIGKKTAAFLKEQFPEMNQETREKIAKERRIVQQEAQLIPAIEEFLSSLPKLHFGIVTGTSSAVVKKTLKKYALTDYFQTIIGGEDFISSKPDPECYLLALKRSGLKASETIIIEDSPAGVRAGKAAGCQVWGLLTSVEKLPEADKSFIDYQKMLIMLKEF